MRADRELVRVQLSGVVGQVYIQTGWQVRYWDQHVPAFIWWTDRLMGIS